MPEPRLNNQGLLDIWMIANTPNFMFERFRRDASVSAISKAYSADRLLSISSSYARSTEFDDKVRAYAYLIALSYKPAGEARNVLAAVSPLGLKWFTELTNLILRTASTDITNTQSFESSPKILKADYATISSAPQMPRPTATQSSQSAGVEEEHPND